MLLPGGHNNIRPEKWFLIGVTFALDQFGIKVDSDVINSFSDDNETYKNGEDKVIKIDSVPIAINPKLNSAPLREAFPKSTFINLPVCGEMTDKKEEVMSSEGGIQKSSSTPRFIDTRNSNSNSNSNNEKDFKEVNARSYSSVKRKRNSHKRKSTGSLPEAEINEVGVEVEGEDNCLNTEESKMNENEEEEKETKKKRRLRKKKSKAARSQRLSSVEIQELKNLSTVSVLEISDSISMEQFKRRTRMRLVSFPIIHFEENVDASSMMNSVVQKQSNKMIGDPTATDGIISEMNPVQSKLTKSKVNINRRSYLSEDKKNEDKKSENKKSEDKKSEDKKNDNEEDKNVSEEEITVDEDGHRRHHHKKHRHHRNST